MTMLYRSILLVCLLGLAHARQSAEAQVVEELLAAFTAEGRVSNNVLEDARLDVVCFIFT